MDSTDILKELEKLKLRKKAKRNIILAIFGLICGFPAWIWLVSYNWKLALALFFILFQENLSKRINQDDRI